MFLVKESKLFKIAILENERKREKTRENESYLDLCRKNPGKPIDEKTAMLYTIPRADMMSVYEFKNLSCICRCLVDFMIVPFAGHFQMEEKI